jgi:hypothetical protein
MNQSKTTLEELKDVLKPEFPKGHFTLRKGRTPRENEELSIILDDEDSVLFFWCKSGQPGPIRVSSNPNIMAEKVKDAVQDIQGAVEWAKGKSHSALGCSHKSTNDPP